MKYQTLVLALLNVPIALALVAQPAPGSGPGGPGRAGREAPTGSIVFEAVTWPKDDVERKVLDVLDDMDRTQRRGSMSVPVQDGRILRLLVESLGAKNVVEIGTSIGYSGLWMALGLKNTGGTLTTYDIDPGRASIARENFARAGMSDRITLVLGDAHEEVVKLKNPIDLLFLDADKEGYLDYLDKLLPLVRPGGLVVAHNINQRQADPRFVKEITENQSLETLFLNMESSGISVSMKKR